MSMYQLPKFKLPKLKKLKIKIKCPKFRQAQSLKIIILTILLSSIFGLLAGAVSGSYFFTQTKDYLSKLNIKLPEPQVIEEDSGQEPTPKYQPQTTREEKIIRLVKEVSPAVVSIVVTKDVPIIEEEYVNPFQDFEEFFGKPFEFQIPEYRQKGTEKKEIGGGTGFIVSDKGMILTNRHVVMDEEADYTVFTNDGEKYPAEVLARDPLRDLAVIKIEPEKTINEKGKLHLKSLPTVRLGDSDDLQIGQTVIAIGNALGEFRNTVSVGVISGLGRTVTASGGGIIETLEDVIQTDAAINRGNSGGPLLNLEGEVIGVNFAMAQVAENIGFAIPINKAKRDIKQVQTLGKIVFPFLGVRYILINDKIQRENDLPVNYGAWIIKGNQGEPAISPDSAAEKAGLQEGDIILEFNKEKVTTSNSLAKIIDKYDPGDKIVLKILRDGEEKIIQLTLGQRSE